MCNHFENNAPEIASLISLDLERRSLYVFTNARHTNPLYRVTPRALLDQTVEVEYDTENYQELLLEAVETVLGYFGFDRTAIGDPPKKRMKWWQRLNEERLRDRNTERI